MKLQFDTDEERQNNITSMTSFVNNRDEKSQLIISAFRARCSEISDHKELFAANLTSYNLAPNKFVGMDVEILKNTLCRTVPPPTLRAMPAAKKTVYPPVPAAYDKSKNWCYLHNPPRDQQTCGACWV